MTVGSFEGRVLLAAAFVAVLLAWELASSWLRRKRQERREAAEKGPDGAFEGVLPFDPTLSAETAAGAKDGDAPTPGFGPGAHGPANAAASDEAKARKAWQSAREMPHQFIPDWEHDEEYLTLLYEAASGGSVEAMNKLSDYAFRRQAFVESYYWKLKLQMSGGRISGMMMRDILGAWVACGCPTQYRNVMRGFSEEQGMFTRAVMRLNAGIDLANAGRRLKQLAKAGNADAQQYLKRSGAMERRE